MITHPGARYAARCGSWPDSSSSSRAQEAPTRDSSSTSRRIEELPAGADFERILVPMKLGDIGEEMVATAIALAKERGGAIEAITVVRVPRKFDARRRAPGGGRSPRRRVARRGPRARRRPRRRGARRRRARALDRPRDRRRGRAAQRRPHRARLVAAVAAAVPLLLADRRLRPPPCAVRGARRRVPRRNASRSRLRCRERRRHRVRPGRLLRREGARRRRLGRHASSTRTRTRSRGSAQRGAEGSSSATAWTSTVLERGRRGGSRRRGRRDGRRQHEHRHRPGADSCATGSRPSSCACSIRRARSSTLIAGMRIVCPTQTAISELLDTVRAAAPQASSA